jgi:hypothetical protein
MSEVSIFFIALIQNFRLTLAAEMSVVRPATVGVDAIRCAFPVLTESVARREAKLGRSS